MKKSFLILLVLSLVLAACGGSAEEETVEEPAVVEEIRQVPIKKDRADLEAELARLDAERNLRTPQAEEPKSDPRLDALHDQLSELDF